MAPDRIVWSQRALSDLHDIEDWLTDRSPQGARNVMRSIRRTIDLLLANPMLGRRESRGYGRLLIEPRYKYVIAYRVTDARIEILYVMHGRRSR